ncbi:MAG: phosphopentomutase [Oscillospiraceae bacterium]
MSRRAFIIVLDSFGIGEMPDSMLYGDAGSNTLAACYSTGKLDMPNMQKLGLFNIDGVTVGEKSPNPQGCFAKMKEQSRGKDTTIGHWEISGIVSNSPLPTFPNGFPPQFIEDFEKRVGRKVLCNKPYSGTQVIEDFGKEHIETGALIVYTSADSVLQICAHEEVVPLEKLYEYCEIAREMLTGELAVGRVIARPFIGEYPNFERTPNRHDFSLAPPKPTMLDVLKANNFDTIAVGKINDIFAGKGVTQTTRTTSNKDGMEKTIEFAKQDFDGLCFVNLVDFDMKYGHRNDPDGYTNALNEFDKDLEEFMKFIKEDDIVILTADHGCDPSTPSTDHSREFTPMIIFGDKVKKGVNLGIRGSFADIAATIEDYFGIETEVDGISFLDEVIE